MSTVLWVIGICLLGVLVLGSLGIAITKKDMEDYDALSRYVDTCEKTEDNLETCLEEWWRLWNRGRVSVDAMKDLRAKMMRRFR